MNIKEIIKRYLEENGYGGLVNVDGECGCPVDDLFLCSGEWINDCEAAYPCLDPKCNPEVDPPAYCLRDPIDCEYIKKEGTE